MSTWAIFSDEGVIEPDFYSKEEAVAALAKYDEADGCHAAECCHDHPERPSETCEECDADEEEPESTADEDGA